MVDQKIVDFIKKMLKDGISLNTIKTQLKEKGWPESEVNDAIQSAIPSETPAPKRYCWNCGTENDPTAKLCKNYEVNLEGASKKKGGFNISLFKKKNIWVISVLVGLIVLGILGYSLIINSVAFYNVFKSPEERVQQIQREGLEALQEAMKHCTAKNCIDDSCRNDIYTEKIKQVQTKWRFSSLEEVKTIIDKNPDVSKIWRCIGACGIPLRGNSPVCLLESCVDCCSGKDTSEECSMMMKIIEDEIQMIQAQTKETAKMQDICASEVMFDIKSVCKSGDDYKVLIRNNGKNIKGFVIRVYQDENTRKSLNKAVPIDTLKEGTLTIAGTEIAELTEVRKIETLPIIEIDGKEVTCYWHWSSFGDAGISNGIKEC